MQFRIRSLLVLTALVGLLVVMLSKGRSVGPPNLSGTVRDSLGRPVKNVRISLYCGSRGARWEAGSTLTDSNGRYRFAPLPVDTKVNGANQTDPHVMVGLRLEHPTQHSVDGRSSWDLELPLINGSEQVRDFTLTAGGDLEMELTCPDGRPARAIGLRLSSPSSLDPQVVRYTATDESGQTHLTMLPPGRWEIEFHEPGRHYRPLGTVAIEDQKNVTVTFSLPLPNGPRK